MSNVQTVLIRMRLAVPAARLWVWWHTLCGHQTFTRSFIVHMHNADHRHMQQFACTTCDVTWVLDLPHRPGRSRLRHYLKQWLGATAVIYLIWVTAQIVYYLIFN